MNFQYLFSEVDASIFFIKMFDKRTKKTSTYKGLCDVRTMFGPKIESFQINLK